MSACRLCDQELIVELDPDSFDEATSSSVGVSQSAPDDLTLGCRCRFHWQCLLDESPSMAIKLECPSCHTSIVTTGPGPSATNRISPTGTQQPQVLTRYHNEGGIQEDLDILPLITEEAYLDVNPAARPARAFLVMCGEGDVAGIVELLKAIEEDRDEDDMPPADILRYQDPLNGNMTGLHLAIEKHQQEVLWLLLWLASKAQTHIFPEEVVQATQSLEAERATDAGVDIRVFRDEQERTAEDIAISMGNTWAGLLAAGILRG
ncbi:hypothetical protein BJ875DRAFT_460656 [Amylocarpus encephaloides]|uniref:Uncharacterized protein n=1 Tax=Amylocarpus encephaloides TaxID=45428 RepID=A0A9P7YJN7_9HELO|nr:hypothetical protein BJ875DRAFT_460656 [Amylocarpus encephaloides]